MGTVGDTFDNALIEAFWARLQTELLNRKKWKTRIELSTALLTVHAVSAHGFSQEGTQGTPSLRESVGQAKRLVNAIGADLGVAFDRAGERLFLIDEQAREIPVEQALLLFLRLMGTNGRRGKLAFPVTVTSRVEQMVNRARQRMTGKPAAARRARAGSGRRKAAKRS